MLHTFLLAFVMAAGQAPPPVVVGRVVDAATGREMPATIAIRLPDGRVLTESPNFRGGFRSSGRFEKPVVAGRISVTASRGFDYIAETRELEFQGGERREVEFRLRRRSPLRQLGWVAGDSHVHMIHGERDIVVGFEDVALAARAEGLDYLSVAQHWNIPRPTPEALSEACRRVSTEDFRMTWNLEAPKNYWRGDAGRCVGHGWTLGMRGRTADGRDAIAELQALSAWDYESEKPPVPNFEMHALIRSLGGISVYTHPHRWWWGKWGGQGGYPVEERKRVSNMAAELPFDTVAGPTYDAIDIMMQPEERETNRRALELWFLLLNRGYRIAATASSDTTFDRPGGGVPGKVRLYTRVAGEPTFEAIAEAVKAGRNFVTSGPLVRFTIGEHEVGDVVPARPGVARIQAWGATRIELIRNGEVVRTWDSGDDVSAEVAGDGWYIARVYAAEQVAITNPIYFEGARVPQPEPARVEGTVRDRESGAALDGVVEVIEMVGRQAIVRGTERVQGGKFNATVPATARLRVRVNGYAPQTKSVFMDYEPLLKSMLEMTAERLSDWQTFEETRKELQRVKLAFKLGRTPGAGPGGPARTRGSALQR